MPRTTPPNDAISEIYLDESSQTKHRWLALGGIIVPKPIANQFTDRITELKFENGLGKECKWTKVSAHHLAGYTALCDAFFDCRDLSQSVHFHTIIVDTSKRNNQRFNGGSVELGFNKEVYQLLQKFRRLYRDPVFHVYPDYRTSSQSTEETRLILNRGARKSGDPRDWPFRRVHFRRSKNTPILQVVDVLLGGLAFEVNGHAKAANASPAKCELSRHILTRAGVRNAMRDTSIAGKYTIWHRKLV